MVAESIMLLVSAVVPVAIVGIALGAMVYGAFMVLQAEPREVNTKISRLHHTHLTYVLSIYDEASSR